METRERQRARRARLKAHGLCVDCSGLPAPEGYGITVKAKAGLNPNGKPYVLCEGCLSDRRVAHHERYSPKARDERRLSLKLKQQEARA